MRLFHLFIFLLYLCIGISPFTAFFQDIVGKNYAFAIISRLAKSLGNSSWNKKHENNM